jgi:predicted RNase H-like HicB family nuclease
MLQLSVNTLCIFRALVAAIVARLSGHRNGFRPCKRRYLSQDFEDGFASSRFGGRIMKAYTVLYEWGTRNWSAYVPDLPGCIATGKTRQHVEQMIREAIEFHIEGMRARGEKVPEPSIEAGTVTVGVE